MSTMANIAYFDLDTTGPKIFNDICNLSLVIDLATVFSSYVMPAGNFTYQAQKRLALKICSWQHIRVLKDWKTKQAVRTKSLFLAMQEFISLLNNNKKDNKKYILAYFSETNLPCLVFLDSAKRFQLLPSLMNHVHSFVNLYDIFKCNVAGVLDTGANYDLKLLATILLDEDENKIDISRSQYRVQLVAKIANHLHQGIEKNEILNTFRTKEEVLSDVTKAVDDEYDILTKRKDLNPIFRSLFSYKKSRGRMVKYRNKLVACGITYGAMKEKWQENQLEEFLKDTVKEPDELIKIIIDHFKLRYKDSIVNNENSSQVVE